MPSKYGFGNTRKVSPHKKSSGFKMKGSPYKFNGGTGSVIGAATMAGSFKPRTRPPVNRPPGNPLGPQRGSGRTTLSNRARGF